MATIKAYTDIKQSRKLAEILPLESADMCYPLPYEEGDKPLLEKGGFGSTPCWSLSSLLDVLPTKLQIVLAINDFQGKRKEKYVVGSVEHDKYDCFADNAIDACYAITLKLHELNLL